MSEASERPYALKEAADRLGVSYDHALHLVQSGELDAFHVGRGKIKRQWRVRPEALEEFRRSRSNHVGSDATESDRNG